MDKDEFLKLTLDSEPTLFHVSFSILHDEQDCADSVQEAILKAYENRHKLREIKYFKTWIVRIVINECYSLLRRKKRFQAVNDTVWQDPMPRLFWQMSRPGTWMRTLPEISQQF